MCGPLSHAEAGLSRRDLLRSGLIATGGVLLGGITGLAGAVTPAAASPPEPRVYTTAEWNARPPNGTITVLTHPPDHIVVHHTASDNVTDYSLNQAFALAHWIQNLHMDKNGWIDSGQQLTISRGGYVLEGRHKSLYAIGLNELVLGAQTLNQNSHTIGIENEGLYTSVAPTAKLYSSLIDTCAWLCGVHGLDPHVAIVGHRDYVSTTVCPGDVLYGMLPDLRNKVAARLGG
jgi:N-acetylmuramoyl-L-alanine amidase